MDDWATGGQTSGNDSMTIGGVRWHRPTFRDTPRPPARPAPDRRRLALTHDTVGARMHSPCKAVENSSRVHKVTVHARHHP